MAVCTARIRAAVRLFLLLMCIKSGSGMDLDVAFILSGSSALGEQHFSSLRRFVVALINSLPRTGTHVGVVLYSKTATLYFLNWQEDLVRVADTLRNFQYPDSFSNISGGLYLARTKLFNRDRPNVPDVAIIVTDGVSNRATEETIPSARALRADGVRIISVGVGSSLNEPVLQAISSPPQTKDRDYFTSLDVQGVIDSLNSRFGITLIPVTTSTTTERTGIILSTTDGVNLITSLSTPSNAPVSSPGDRVDMRLVIIIVPIVGGLLLIIIITLVVCKVRNSKKESETEPSHSIADSEDPVYNENVCHTRPHEDDPVYFPGSVRNEYTKDPIYNQSVTSSKRYQQEPIYNYDSTIGGKSHYKKQEKIYNTGSSIGGKSHYQKQEPIYNSASSIGGKSRHQKQEPIYNSASSIGGKSRHQKQDPIYNSASSIGGKSRHQKQEPIYNSASSIGGKSRHQKQEPIYNPGSAVGGTLNYQKQEPIYNPGASIGGKSHFQKKPRHGEAKPKRKGTPRPFPIERESSEEEEESPYADAEDFNIGSDIPPPPPPPPPPPLPHRCEGLKPPSQDTGDDTSISKMYSVVTKKKKKDTT